jgi:vacuolar protein sorting-associated protein 13A/C
MKISARERFNFNLSTTFAELALTTARVLGRENERISKKIRGSYAPYRIHNRVGRTIGITSVSDGGNNAKARGEHEMEIPHDKSVDWRFDDWKTMREV